MIAEKRIVIQHTDGKFYNYGDGTEKEYEDYSLAILKMREVLGDKYVFSVSLHPVCYKISKEAIAAVDFISYQCYGPSPVRFPMEKYCSDIQMALAYGIPKEKLVS